jgi:hypothetical protein
MLLKSASAANKNSKASFLGIGVCIVCFWTLLNLDPQSLGHCYSIATTLQCYSVPIFKKQSYWDSNLQGKLKEVVLSQY